MDLRKMEGTKLILSETTVALRGWVLSALEWLFSSDTPQLCLEITPQAISRHSI
jgi:hypothetical protein